MELQIGDIQETALVTAIWTSETTRPNAPFELFSAKTNKTP